MARNCIEAVRRQVGGVFSEAEIDDLLNRVADRARRTKKAAPDLSEREAISSAARELTHEQILTDLLKKRNEIFTERSREENSADIDAMPKSMRESARLSAAMIGTERQGHGTSRSTDAEGAARAARIVAEMERGLKETPGLWDRLVQPFGLPESGFPEKVSRELARLNGNGQIEPTGDEQAFRAAQIIARAQRLGMEMQNEAGAWIGELKGYIARQTHDAEKIAGGYWRELGQFKEALARGEMIDWRTAQDRALTRAFQTWRDFITPRLEERTFDNLENRDFDFAVARELQARGIIRDATDLRELMLHQVFMNILTGVHEELSGADAFAEYRPSATSSALARAVSRPRTLHYKPDGWMEYNAKYGKGSLMDTIVQQLMFAGQNTALMRRWGPSPQLGFEFQRQRLIQQARARGDANEVKRLNSKTLTAKFETINGRASIAENMRLGQTFRTLRTIEALSKLGSIILSKVTDLPLAAHTAARAGGSMMDGYMGAMKGLLRTGSAEAKEAADAMYVGWRGFASTMAGSYWANDGPPGVGSYLTFLLHRLNGFEGVNEGFRNGAAQVLSNILGRQSDRPWEGLRAETRAMLERFALGPEDWEAVRHGLEAAPDGRTYFTLDHVEDLANQAKARIDPAAKPEAQAAARAEALAADDRRWKFAALVHNYIDDAVSHPRARESVMMAGASDAGTWWGEFRRSFFQFKGFVSTIFNRHLIPAMSGYAGQSPLARLATIAHFWVAGAAAGYVGMSLKQLAAGQMPHAPLSGDPKENLKVWLGALAQSGGLGIYGDFLFGTQNRAGAAFDLGAIGGPLASDAEQIAQVVVQAVHGGAISEKTGRSQIPGELVRLGGHLVPFANLFYARLAFDYLVLWNMQEAASPGFLQKYENRVEHQEGGQFIVRPTSAYQSPLGRLGVGSAP